MTFPIITGAQPKVACSRLRDGGGKSFSNKKCENRARAGERQAPRWWWKVQGGKT